MSPQRTTGTSSQLRRSLTSATGKFEAIIDAAEEAAVQIREEARCEARSYLVSRRHEIDEELAARAMQVEDAVDPLLHRLQELGKEANALGGELERAVERLRSLVAASDGPREHAEAPLQEPPRKPETQGTQEANGSTPARKPAGDPKPSNGATTTARTELTDLVVLRVTQMAVSGRPRSEIENALREEFAVADPAALVARIIGPDTG